MRTEIQGTRSVQKENAAGVGKCNIKSRKDEQKTGHWERMCHTKSVSEVTENYQASYFLGSVSNADKSNDQWTVQILIGATPGNNVLTLEQKLV